MAKVTKQLNVALNRVEGDLEVCLNLEDGVVRDAWSVGTMYRGFENMMRGRGALDGLVITPRICGICGTAHLLAAVEAIENAMGVTPPPNAERLRQAALLCEKLQSDLRHGALMFMADFTNTGYRGAALYEEACTRYEPFKGSTVIEVIRESKKILEVVAIIGGQWPHSSYMVPGGVTTEPRLSDVQQCGFLISNLAEWYEQRMLGCSVARWQEITSEAELDAWLSENDAHANSDVGFFIRFAREIGLARLGKGHGNYLSYGSRAVASPGAEETGGLPSGMVVHGQNMALDPGQVREHVVHSWYRDEDDGLPPGKGSTVPQPPDEENGKYSWVKAPRYTGHPAETGPLAEMVVAGNPLFVDLTREGPNAFVRELARLVRPAYALPVLGKLMAGVEMRAEFYTATPRPDSGTGVGLVQAARGALGHWVTFKDGLIEQYQVITPTSWNGSPRDNAGVRGPWEEALVGTTVADPENPVEIGHVVRSFDACLVCAVHAVQGSGTLFKVNV